MSRIVWIAEGRFERPCRAYWGRGPGWLMAGWTRDRTLAVLFADANEAEAVRAAAERATPGAEADVVVERIEPRS